MLGHRQHTQPPLALHQVQPEIPPALSKVVLRLLEKAPENRYQHARALIHDLEHCLHTWRQHHYIAPFELAQAPVSGLLRFPEKIIGREDEQARLLRAWQQAQQGHGKLLVLQGALGVGKTHLLGSLYEPVQLAGGYFLHVHTLPSEASPPYYAWVQVMRKFIRFLLARPETEWDWWQHKLRHALRAEGGILLPLIPELETLLPGAFVAPVGDLPVSERKHRIEHALVTMMRTMAHIRHPLVVIIDELSQLDPASEEILARLVSCWPQLPALFVGVIEASAQDPDPVLPGCLQGRTETLTLKPWTESTLRTWLAATLQRDEASLQAFSQTLFAYTHGMPLHAQAALQALHRQGQLWVDAQSQAWTWAPREALLTTLGQEPLRWLDQAWEQLAPASQQLLNQAACLGQPISQRLLRELWRQPVTLLPEALQQLAQAGWLLPEPEGYRFVHPAVQKLVYRRIPEAVLGDMHAQIGSRLFRLGPETVGCTAFDAVLHLNRGKQQVPGLYQGLRLCRLNLYAARMARQQAAFCRAGSFAAEALALLPANAWDQQGRLSRQVYLLAGELALWKGDLKQAEGWLKELLAHPLEGSIRLHALGVYLQLLVAKGEVGEALRQGLAALRDLSIVTGSHPTHWRHRWRQLWVRARLLWGGPSRRHARLRAADRETQALMELLGQVSSALYEVAPRWAPVFANIMLELTLKHGLSPQSATACVTYGLTQAGKGHFGRGFAFGKLALELSARFDHQGLRGRIAILHHYFLHHLRHPFREALPALKQLREVSRRSGERQFETYAETTRCLMGFMGGIPLPEILVRLEARAEEIKDLAGQTPACIVGLFRAAIYALMYAAEPGAVPREASPPPAQVYLQALLNGDSQLESQMGELGQGVLPWLVTFRLLLAYLLNQPQGLNAYLADERRLKQVFGDAAPLSPIGWLLVGLGHLRLAGQADQAERRWRIKVARQASKKLRAWAKKAPVNYAPHDWLLRGELLRVKGQAGRARNRFDQAIDAAQERQQLLLEALGYELAGQNFADQGRARLAADYRRRAAQVYAKWGAGAKLAVSPHLPPPLLASPQPPQEKAETSLEHVLEVARVLADEIYLPALKKRSMDHLLSLSGAQRGVLLRQRDQQWFIESDSSQEEEAPARPLSDQALLPLSMLHYVARVRVPLQWSASEAGDPFRYDTYLQALNPKSALCLPLRHQGQLLGMVYLEHLHLPHVFHLQQLKLLEILAGQLALSLQHAFDYQHLEQTIVDRTQELRKQKDRFQSMVGELRLLNQDLARTTRQLEESNQELSQLAHVTSHDLLSPLNAMLWVLEQMDPPAKPQDQHLLASAIEGAKGAVELVKSILAYAQLGRELSLEPVSLTEVMEAVAQNLGYLTSEKPGRIHYAGELPEVWGNFRQLVRLFQNLVTNGLTYNDAPLPEVTIRAVSHQGGWLVEVADNGRGISEADQGRIFQMFMRVGKNQEAGTGIGLAVCRSIVELHHGSLEVSSALGEGSVFSLRLPARPFLAQDEGVWKPGRQET